MENKRLQVDEVPKRNHSCLIYGVSEIEGKPQGNLVSLLVWKMSGKMGVCLFATIRTEDYSHGGVRHGW